MNRALRLLLLTLPTLLCGSCGAAAEPESAVEAAQEPAPAVVAARASEPAAEVAVEPVEALAVAEEATPSDGLHLPDGVFADLAEMCSRQMKAAGPQIAAAAKEYAEYGMGPSTTAPACAEDREAIRHMKTVLREPFRDLTAVSFEGGYARYTQLVARTEAGWVAVGTPLTAEFHNDPGCPSIMRDGSFVDAHVEPAPTEGSQATLVVVHTAGRGWGSSELNLQLARGCRLDATASSLPCTEPVTIGATEVPYGIDETSDTTPRTLFDSPYHLDAHGAVVTTRTWEGSI